LCKACFLQIWITTKLTEKKKAKKIILSFIYFPPCYNTPTTVMRTFNLCVYMCQERDEPRQKKKDILS